MSVNIADTRCQRCGFWEFEDEDLEGKPLLTLEEYKDAVGATWRYRVGYGGDEYRWAFAACPVCRVEYALWLRGGGDWEWTVYDLSYWSSFGDEPGPNDVRNALRWDRSEWRAACLAAAEEKERREEAR